VITISGTVGTRHDLQVRLGATLTPLVLELQLGSGEPVVSEGTALLAFLYAHEADLVPLAEPAFVVSALAPSATGAARYLLELSREAVAQLAALPLEVVGGKPPRVRLFWWTLFFEDSAGARVPVFYGRLSVVLGAAGG
jgi:hypothetical protein